MFSLDTIVQYVKGFAKPEIENHTKEDAEIDVRLQKIEDERKRIAARLKLLGIQSQHRDI